MKALLLACAGIGALCVTSIDDSEPPAATPANEDP
jgi:hypothetical protein